MPRLFAAILLWLCLTWSPSASPAAETPCGAETLPSWVNVVQPEIRQRFRNPDGSCVQCSIGIMGSLHDVAAAETLLWQSPFGPPIRGGSHPYRVAEYCRARKIPIYNVNSQEATAYVEWALSTGRNAAITWGAGHMITAVGMSPDKQTFAVVDNNSPQRVDLYRRGDFLRRFLGYPGGGWTVILAGPAPTPVVPPALTQWWTRP